MQTLVQPFFQAMFWAALLDHTDSSTLLASCHANQKETPIGREKPPLKNRAHGAPDSACIVFLFCRSVVLQMVSPSPHLQILFLFCPNSLCTWLRAASHWMKAVLVRNLLKSFILKNKPFRVTPQSDGKVIFLCIFMVRKCHTWFPHNPELLCFLPASYFTSRALQSVCRGEWDAVPSCGTGVFALCAQGFGSICSGTVSLRSHMWAFSRTACQAKQDEIQPAFAPGC